MVIQLDARGAGRGPATVEPGSPPGAEVGSCCVWVKPGRSMARPGHQSQQWWTVRDTGRHRPE